MTELLVSRWSVALAEALVYLLGQGAFIVVVHAALHALAGSHRPRLRYALATAGFFALPVCLVVTWYGLASSHAVGSTALGAPAALSPSSWIVVGWCGGAALMLLRLGASWLRLRRGVASAEATVARVWLDVCDRLVSLAGITRQIEVRASRVADVPMVVGVLRPIVLVPLSLASGVSLDCVEAVLAHELMHVRRHDYLVNLLQSVVEALLFYHPAVWWLSHRMRVEREYCCDDDAAHLLEDRLGYARALVELEQLRGGVPALALGASGGPLKKRILRILQPTAPASRPGPSALGGLVVLVTIVAALATGVGAKAANRALLAAWLPPDVSQHAEVVLRAAERHGVDADLVAAMMLIESGGDPDAESPAGAAGLMQIMPQTARRIAEARGLDAPDASIYDPELNVDFGAWYLAQQLDRFGELRLAVTAYNAGPEQVQAHVDRHRPLPDESVRYAEQVMALWSERKQPTSPTLSRLLERTRARLREQMKAPVALDDVRLGFGPRTHPIRKEPYDHQGIDVRHALGTAVHAPLPGVVRSVDAAGTDARGRYVVLQHGRVQTRYYHLDAVDVEVGQCVKAGERIGAVGNTGVSTGPHLHFEVREMGRPVDPAVYYGESER